MKTTSFEGLLHGADYNCDQWLEEKAILDADLVYMRKAGCNVMSVGIFSWSMIEREEGAYDFAWLDDMLDRLHVNGVRVILSTPSGSKPAWMSRKYPETCRVTVDGRREPHGYRHNHCRTSKKYREACVAINAALARRYKGHPALLMWHVSNEYNAMPCYCPECLAAFRAWLKARYGSLDALNRAWWTNFWSHRFSDWEEIAPYDRSIHGMMLDWQRFTSDQTLDFFLAESAPLREISPDVPLTTNFMKPDVGLDYWKFAPHVDVISWDSYPEWHRDGDDISVAAKTAFYHDLFRSFKGKPFLLMESTPGATNWQGISKAKKPGMHELSSLQAIAHGSDSVQYFQWRQSRGGEEKFHGAVVGHDGSCDTRVFGAVARVGDLLGRLGFVAGARTESDVAVVYDFQSGWALDLAQLPRNVGKNYQEECVAHYCAFWRRGISVDVIDSSACSFSCYRLVVIPMLYMLKAGVDEKIRAYVMGGGTVVATYLTGLVDDSDLCVLGGVPGGLVDVFGASAEYTDTVTDCERQAISYRGKRYTVTHYADAIRMTGAEAVARYCVEPLARAPAVTRNRFGRGVAHYLAPRAGDGFLDAFYGDLCSEIGIKPCVSWKIPRGVSVVRRRAEGRDVFFALNFGAAPTRMKIGKGYIDALADTAAPGTVTLGQYGFAVFTDDHGQ